MTISFVGAGTLLEANNSAGTHTLNASVANDDTTFLFCSSEGSGGTFAVTSETWDTVSNNTGNAASADSNHIHVFKRKRQAGDSDPVITYTGGGNGYTIIVNSLTFRSSGGDSINADLTGAFSENTSAFDIGPLSAPGTDASAGLVLAYGHRADDAASHTTLTGDGLTWAQGFHSLSTIGGDAVLVVDYAIASSTVTLTAKTFSLTGGSSDVGAGQILTFTEGTTPAEITSVSGDDIVIPGETATVVWAQGGTGTTSATINGVTQTSYTVNSDTDTDFTVVLGDSRYGASYNLDVDTGYETHPVTFNPAAGLSFVDLSGTLATSGERITSIPDLAAGDQLEYDSVTTPSGYPVLVNSDGSFTITGATPSGESFDVRAYDNGDDTWGSTATQTVSGVPVITGPTTINQSEHVALSQTYTITNRNGETPTLSGTDSSFFTITSASGDDFSLQMVGKDFETPEDANTDNSYEVTINIDNLVDPSVTLDVSAVIADVTVAGVSLGADVTDVELNTYVVKSFTPSTTPGSGGYAVFATDSGEVSLDNVNFFTNVVALDGATIYARVLSSGSYSTGVTGGVSIEGSSDTFTATTRAILTPTITTQPTNQSVVSDQIFTFTVVATDAVSYQWYDASDDSVITGETAATYTGTAQLSQNGLQVYCICTSSEGGTAQTNTVTLTVTGVDFWQVALPSQRIIGYKSQRDINNSRYTVFQDEGSTLGYWLDMSKLLGDSTITSVSVDPDSILPTDVTVTSRGTNATAVTDSNGINYPTGTLAGVTFSGGKYDNIYRVVVSALLDSNDTLVRSFWMRLVP